MKSSVKILCVIRLIGCSFIPFSFIVMLLSISVAHAIPVATSNIYLEAGPLPTINQNYVPSTMDQSLNYSYTFPPPNNNSVAATSYLKTLFDGGGYVEAGATAYASAATTPGRNIRAAAGGGVQFYFNVNQTQTPPISLSTVPIQFISSGTAWISGDYGEFIVNSAILGVGQYQISWKGSPGGATYQESYIGNNTYYLQPSINPYRVIIGGDVIVSASAVLAGDTSQSEGFMTVDPIIRFDQAAFDAIYGPSSFRLSDYYTLEFSPNLPVSTVPEPGILILLSISMASIVGLKRWWRD